MNVIGNLIQGVLYIHVFGNHLIDCIKQVLKFNYDLIIEIEFVYDILTILILQIFDFPSDLIDFFY